MAQICDRILQIYFLEPSGIPKKMSETLSQKTQKKRKMVFASDVQPYLPATLRKWKSGWMIVYYVENPETHVWERKRQRVEHLRNYFQTDKGAIHHASKMIKSINVKLEQGYGFGKTDSSRN